MAKLSHNQKSFNSDNKLFDEQWITYQKLLDNNYMGHQEIYRIVHQFLGDRYNKPFNLLDLGCGDASFAAKALLNTPINFYLGIDLSESALEIARDNMAKLPGKKRFSQGNLFESIFQLEQSQDNSFDVILASFSLHHLTLSQKERFIAQLPHLLKTDGIFLLIDIVRLPEENREEYIKRYLNNVRQDWTLLTTQEFLRIEKHIKSSDFPETQETLYSFARKYGFARIDRLYQDPLETTQCLCFYR
ncbi:class I SAM-dependent methyltransferase [Pleurocapsa sp. PCC 7319]|uniref:class I SAM-dependent methyltransferase n=1 Tax=Pleurocapsa sp. PCC 7319 TaxID=118161 RepID=UPI000344FE3A|nr:class I SAM-dependent methyltransferase [Pleurocapsa sp. PCC 7319]